MDTCPIATRRASSYDRKLVEQSWGGDVRRAEVPRTGEGWRMARKLRLGLALMAVGCTLLPTAAAAGRALPPGKVIASVYCQTRQNTNCFRAYGPGPARYMRAPRGYSKRLHCRWYNTGWSSSLAVDKNYCVRRT